MSTDKPQKLVANMRNVRYAEVLGVYVRGSDLYAEVWGTQMLHDCPLDWWNSLDPGVVKTDLDAIAVKMNGPRNWVLEGFGNKTAHIEPVIRDFNGLPRGSRGGHFGSPCHLGAGRIRELLHTSVLTSAVGICLSSDSFFRSGS